MTTTEAKSVPTAASTLAEWKIAVKASDRARDKCRVANAAWEIVKGQPEENAAWEVAQAAWREFSDAYSAAVDAAFAGLEFRSRKELDFIYETMR